MQGEKSSPKKGKVDKREKIEDCASLIFSWFRDPYLLAIDSDLELCSVLVH